MTTIKHWNLITAVIDDVEKNILLRIRKAGPDELVVSNETALKRQAISELQLDRLLDQGYELIEDNTG